MGFVLPLMLGYALVKLFGPCGAAVLIVAAGSSFRVARVIGRNRATTCPPGSSVSVRNGFILSDIVSYMI